MNLDQVSADGLAEGVLSRVAQHSGLLSVAAGIVGILSYACTILMTNTLGPADFSNFAAGQMLLGMVGVVASALVPLPLAHAVAAHPRGSEDRRDAVAFAALISLLSGATAAAVTGFVAGSLGSPMEGAVVALSAFVLFVGAANTGWLQGELRFVRCAAKGIGEVLIRLLFSILVIAMSWGASGAILGFAVGGLALFVTPASFYRDLAWRPRVLLQKWRWAETADIALALCVVSILVGLDVVAVAFLDGGSTEAAGFQSLATIAKAPIYVSAGTVLVAFPLLRASGIQTHEVLTAALRSFGRLALLAFAVIATAPTLLVALVLPQRYYESLSLLPWLALAGLGYATVTVLSTLLLALRTYRRCQLGLVTACVIVPMALFVGYQVNGVRGLAVGSAVGAVLAAVALALMAHPVFPPGLARMALRRLPLAAALILIFMLAALQPGLWLIATFGAGVTVLAIQSLDGTPQRSRRVSFLMVAVTPRLRFRRGRSRTENITENAGDVSRPPSSLP